MFKVCYSVSIINFEHAIVGWEQYSEAYSELSQTSKMKLFAKIVN